MAQLADKFYIGIDVSKKMLDVCIDDTNRLRISNDTKGITKLINLLKDVPNPHVVMEATGGYETKLSHTLMKAGITVSVVNARCVRDFARSKNILAKTDKLDAYVIRAFAQSNHPRASRLPSDTEIQLTHLRNRREQVVKFIVFEKQHTEKADKSMMKYIKQTLKLMEKQKAELDAQIAALIERVPDFKEKSEIISSVKGIGPASTTTILCDLPELGDMESKAISSMVGLAPFNRDSGQLKGRRTICGGRARVRKALYIGALSASQHDPMIRAFYLRLLEKGKTKKTALIACAHKMLICLNAMMKTKTQWAPNPPMLVD